jgi:hypothetical protein
MSAQVVAVMPVQTDTKLGALMPEPKLRPSQVAVEALDALDSGLEEVFPGEPTKIAAQCFKADPAALRRCSPSGFTRSPERHTEGR